MARLIVKVKTTAPRPQESDDTNTVVLMVASAPQGDKGDKGDKGDNGANGLNGKDGEKGEKGNVLFATFDINILTGELEMVTPTEYSGASFALNGSNLEVTI